MISMTEIRARLKATPPAIPQEDSGVPPASMPLRCEYPQPGKFRLERIMARAASLCHLPGVLCAWAVRREGQYFDGPGRTWGDQIIGYAVARDMICWLTGKREGEL